MKKLFYLVLVICILMLNLSTPAEAYYYTTETTTETTQETVIEDKLSIRTLFDYESYDDLLAYASQLKADELSLIDRYTRDMIIGISHKMRAPLYHGIRFVSVTIPVEYHAINMQDWDDRFKWIITIYNRTRGEDLRWGSKNLDNDIVQYNFKSEEYCRLQCQALAIGQKVRIIPGSKYYESAWYDGSGKYGFATSKNPFIPEDMEVTVNGVAYYDSIQRSYVISVEEALDSGIDLTRPRMLHVATEDGDLGWFYPESLTTFWN